MRLLGLFSSGLALVMVLGACASSGYTIPTPTREEPSPTVIREEKLEETLTVVNAEGGKALFISKACSGCHTVQGVPEAQGKVGPELTHQASNSLIADVLPNTEENLRKWLKDPLMMKPGTLMPNQNLADSEIDVLMAFLRTLK